jgi:spectinomycin phosphotransferase
MLVAPTIADERIAAHLRQHYGMCRARIAFLPIGDAASAHYRVEAEDGTTYFLKLRAGDLDEVAVTVPAALHAQGVARVMAPIPTTAGSLWVRDMDFAWVLYPFVDGRNGFESPLSPRQWVRLGATLRAIHSADLPAELGNTVPREDYSPRWRDRVRLYQRQVAVSRYDDPLAQRLAAFWLTKRDEIGTLVERAEQLARTLRTRTSTCVLCHTDLHAGNVLLSADDELTIVDWDAPLLALKERDLMFAGAGIGGIWNTADEEAHFYRGYGAVTIDPIALSYYRYQRIVEDLAVYGDQIFGMQGSVEDRERGLRVSEQFLQGGVVEIAHRTYERLT